MDDLVLSCFITILWNLCKYRVARSWIYCGKNWWEKFVALKHLADYGRWTWVEINLISRRFTIPRSPRIVGRKSVDKPWRTKVWRQRGQKYVARPGLWIKRFDLVVTIVLQRRRDDSRDCCTYIYISLIFMNWKADPFSSRFHLEIAVKGIRPMMDFLYRESRVEIENRGYPIYVSSHFPDWSAMIFDKWKIGKREQPR